MKNLNGNIADCENCKVGESGYKFCSGKCSEKEIDADEQKEKQN